MKILIDKMDIPFMIITIALLILLALNLILK